MQPVELLFPVAAQFKHRLLGLHKILQGVVKLNAQWLAEQTGERLGCYQGAAFVVVTAVDFVAHHVGRGHFHEPVFHGLELADFIDRVVHGFTQLA